VVRPGSPALMVLPARGQATVVVASNAADETAVASQALEGESFKISYSDFLALWP
jgi:hypothetical protein